MATFPQIISYDFFWFLAQYLCLFLGWGIGCQGQAVYQHWGTGGKYALWSATAVMSKDQIPRLKVQEKDTNDFFGE